MNEYQLSKKYADITIRFNSNESGSLKPIDYAKDIGQTIVNNMEDYDLSIIRFRLPASAIKKYFVNQGSNDHIIYMMKDRIIGSHDMTLSNKIEVYTPKAMLDYINPALRKTFSEYYLAVIENQTSISTGNVTFSPTAEAGVITKTISVPSSNDDDLTGGCVYMKFKINSITPEYMSDIGQYASSHPKNIYMSLTVGGKEVIILNNPNYTSLSDFAGVTFEDGVPFTNQFDFITGPKIRQPYEPFNKLNSVAVSGDWQMTFFTYEDAQKYTVNYTMEVYFVLPPTFEGPNQPSIRLDPPFLSYDSQNNFILNYSPAWYKSGIKLGFSDLLRNGFDFFEYVNVGSINYLVLPQQEASDDIENTSKITQLQSSMYKFNMIYSIKLLTDINVENEITVRSLTDNSSNENVITDFLPDPALPHDNYFYNASNDYRRYRMSGNKLKSLSIRARVVYLNGDDEQINLKVGEICNVKMELIPIHGLY